MDAAALLRRYHDALNDYDAEIVRGMFAIDASYHSPGTGVRHGRDAIVAAMTAYFSEYPDQIAADDEVIALDANRVRSRWRLKATSNVTGEAIVRRGIEVVTFGADGLIRKVEVEDR